MMAILDFIGAGGASVTTSESQPFLKFCACSLHLSADLYARARIDPHAASSEYQPITELSKRTVLGQVCQPASQQARRMIAPPHG